MEIEAPGIIGSRSMKQCSPLLEEAAASDVGNGGGFDCNICLDFAVDPVVTFCGHLYCWPCIYKWLSVASDEVDAKSCPVCKAALSEDRLVPLYGRGGEGATAKSSEIPRRPRGQSAAIAALEPPPMHRRHHHYYSSGDNAYLLPLETSAFDSMAGGVLKEIAGSMLPWFFSNRPETALVFHHPRTRLIPASSSERARMREVQAHCVLNQLLSFLSVFAILCFLIF